MIYFPPPTKMITSFLVAKSVACYSVCSGRDICIQKHTNESENILSPQEEKRLSCQTRVSKSSVHEPLPPPSSRNMQNRLNIFGRSCPSYITFGFSNLMAYMTMLEKYQISSIDTIKVHFYRWEKRLIKLLLGFHPVQLFPLQNCSVTSR